MGLAWTGVTVLIREKLNQHPGAVGGVVGGLALLAVFVLWDQLSSEPDYTSGIVPNYYTTDDQSPAGALSALFEDDTGKLPPFDKGGKQAYRAYVFTTDGGKTKFVGYLERYTAEGKRLLEEARDGRSAGLLPDQLNNQLAKTGIEVKRPGDRDWVLLSDKKADQVLAVKPPAGGDLAKLESVFP